MLKKIEWKNENENCCLFTSLKKMKIDKKVNDESGLQNRLLMFSSRLIRLSG